MIAEKIDRATTSSNTATRLPQRSTNPRSSVSLPAGASVRYATAQTSTMPRIDERAVRRTKIAPKAKSRLAISANMLQGDSRAIAYFIACFAIVVVMGTIYLSAYARVAAQGRQLDSIRKDIAAETARQHDLVFEIGQAESPQNIAAGATKLGMVMGQQTDYVTVHNSNVAVASNDSIDTPDSTPQGSGVGEH